MNPHDEHGEQRCETCVFWQDNRPLLAPRCKRFPPKASLLHSHPPAPSWGWCGEYRRLIQARPSPEQIARDDLVLGALERWRRDERKKRLAGLKRLIGIR